MTVYQWQQLRREKQKFRKKQLELSEVEELDDGKNKKLGEFRE